MSDHPALDAAELHAQILTASFKRTAAARELADAGINASPGDVEAYVAMSPAERRRIMMTWAILNASYS